MSFRNRMVVAGGNGLVHLSVPLEKGRDQHQPLRDIRISYSLPWQQQHWRGLVSCYGRAPFFDYYRDWLEGFFQRKPVFLIDMNLETLYWLNGLLKTGASISVTDQYLKKHHDTVKDLRGYWRPNNFQTEPPPFRYAQVFEDRLGFQRNLSILDLLFCTGPQAHSLLKGNV